MLLPWSLSMSVVVRGLALMIPWLFGSGTAGALSVAEEYDIKAVYLYNLTKFIQWPTPRSDAPLQPFTICILGKSPFAERLQPLTARNVGTRPIVLVALESSAVVQQCNVLFIARSEDPMLAETLTALLDLPILSVSDMPDFVDRGGMVGFVTVANTIRLEINLTRATRANLVFSAKLLEIARRRVGGSVTGVGTTGEPSP